MPSIKIVFNKKQLYKKKFEKVEREIRKYLLILENQARKYNYYDKYIKKDKPIPEMALGLILCQLYNKLVDMKLNSPFSFGWKSDETREIEEVLEKYMIFEYEPHHWVMAKDLPDYKRYGISGSVWFRGKMPKNHLPKY